MEQRKRWQCQVAPVKAVSWRQRLHCFDAESLSKGCSTPDSLKLSVHFSPESSVSSGLGSPRRLGSAGSGCSVWTVFPSHLGRRGLHTRYVDIETCWADSFPAKPSLAPCEISFKHVGNSLNSSLGMAFEASPKDRWASSLADSQHCPPGTSAPTDRPVSGSATPIFCD